MRSTSAPLVTFLASRPTEIWVADLFTFTLLDGTVLRYSGADVPVTFAGDTWLNVGPNLDRTSWSGKDTTEVPTMEITLSSTGADFVAGNIKTMLHNGVFDGATCQLDRAIGQVAGVPLGLVTLFSGPVGQIQVGAVTSKITVKGWMIVLQQYMPRNTFQTACIHGLYDPGCTLVRADFTASNVCGAGVTTRRSIGVPGPWLLPGAVTAPLDKLRLGTVTITSGPAGGTKRTAAGVHFDGGGIGYVDFAYPLYATPNAADTMTCTFGCDKTKPTCIGTFDNDQHRRSFPYIPPAEQAT